MKIKMNQEATVTKRRRRTTTTTSNMNMSRRGVVSSFANIVMAAAMMAVTVVISSSSYQKVLSFTPPSLSPSSHSSSLCRPLTRWRRMITTSSQVKSLSQQLQLQLQLNNNDRDDGEPDLFDYFDPLLSPHSYPNGVSPDNKPDASSSSSSYPSSSNSKNKSPFGINYYSSNQRESTENKIPPNESSNSNGNVINGDDDGEEDDEEPDLFEYFDPLLSPHSYPNGISPDAAAGISSPRELDVVGKSSSLSSSSSSSIYRSSSEDNVGSTLSENRQTKKRVGILLMDHGSRNEASNKRLQAMAQLYQLNLDTMTMDVNDNGGSDSSSSDTVMIVRAAHMEIAKPSIPDGLKTLVEAGVDEIVCHPYFLSPGRHVVEDIPEIIESAVRDMQIGIPVRTTDPVGSNTQMMLGLIHSSVTSTSQVLGNQQQQQQ